MTATKTLVHLNAGGTGTVVAGNPVGDSIGRHVHQERRPVDSGALEARYRGQLRLDEIHRELAAVGSRDHPNVVGVVATDDDVGLSVTSDVGQTGRVHSVEAGPVVNVAVGGHPGDAEVSGAIVDPCGEVAGRIVTGDQVFVSVTIDVAQQGRGRTTDAEVAVVRQLREQRCGREAAVAEAGVHLDGVGVVVRHHKVGQAVAGHVAERRGLVTIPASTVADHRGKDWRIKRAIGLLQVDVHTARCAGAVEAVNKVAQAVTVDIANFVRL